MEVGGIALLNYGEVPLTWHTRLLLAHTQGSSWVVATPDFDIYEEEMSHSNVDLIDFYYCGPLGAIPARIPAASVYGFAPMGPDRLGELMQQGRVHAAGIRAHLPGAAAPAAPAVPLPGVLGHGAVGGAAPAVAAALPAVPVVGVGGSCWVAIENAGGRNRGDIICTDPAPLPVGHIMLGDKALVPHVSGVGDACFVKKIPVADAPNYKLEDLRVLPVRFDAQGSRRREFNDAVALMVDGVPQGGGLQLAGPTTGLNIVKGLRDQNFTPTTYHEFWVRSAEIPKGDRSTYEHECLSRILESLITIDQLNICALQGAELLVRRMQVIREAHRISPSAPDYSAADHFMGWKYKKITQGVDGDLASFVATELKNEAAIAKESRKAKEEQAQRRRNPGKNSGGGGEGK